MLSCHRKQNRPALTCFCRTDIWFFVARNDIQKWTHFWYQSHTRKDYTEVGYSESKIINMGSIWNGHLLFNLKLEFSPYKSRKISFPCTHGLSDLQKLSAFSLDGSVSYFLDEQIEAGHFYQMMQDSGFFFLEGISKFETFKNIFF